ncbi:MAG: hypothetical protein Q9222_005949 [Ikaeria aurantiellina]
MENADPFDDNVQHIVAQGIEPCLPCIRPQRQKAAIQLPTSAAYKHHNFAEKTSSQPSTTPHEQTLFEAVEAGSSLDVSVCSIVHEAGGWSEYLAKKVMAMLESAIKAGKGMKPVMKCAFDKVMEAVRAFEAFSEEHPVLTGVLLTVVAVGILALLAPWALEALGFGELGPIEGM